MISNRAFFYNTTRFKTYSLAINRIFSRFRLHINMIRYILSTYSALKSPRVPTTGLKPPTTDELCTGISYRNDVLSIAFESPFKRVAKQTEKNNTVRRPRAQIVITEIKKKKKKTKQTDTFLFLFCRSSAACQFV